MAKQTDRSKVIDNIIKFVAGGGMITAAVFLPGSIVVLEKPIKELFDHLDERERLRELKKNLQYMKRQNLIADNYEHGIVLTDKARRRLAQADLESLEIPIPEEWDKKWRIIMYDIPEKHREDRRSLSSRLQNLGLHMLQKSVWVHPYNCEDVINKIAVAHDIEKYITYFEITHINNPAALKRRFASLDLK